MFLFILRRFAPAVVRQRFHSCLGRTARSSMSAVPPLTSFEDDFQSLSILSEGQLVTTTGTSEADGSRQKAGFMVLRVNGQPFGGYPLSYN